MKVVVALLALGASGALGACASLRTDHVSQVIDPKKTIVIAHRGAHACAAENSLGSIRKALALGVDMVELDVRTTRDGALVLLHDETVDRTTNGSGRVASLTAQDVRRCVLRAPSPTCPPERVPFLSAALSLAAERGPSIYLHVKEAAPEAIALAIRPMPPGRVLVFHEERAWLERLHAAAPELAILPLASPGRRTLESLLRAFDMRAFAFDEDDFSDGAARDAHVLGGRVLVDVLGGHDLEKRVLAALGDGADGIQTDEPERVLALLGRGNRSYARSATPSRGAIAESTPSRM